MTNPEPPIALELDSGWVVERVNFHTCGTSRDGYWGAHEPGCGTIPICEAWQWMTYDANEAD